MNLKSLRLIARFRRLRGRYALRKTELETLVKQTLAITKIQRLWRRRKKIIADQAAKCLQRNWRRCRIWNTRDPITQEDIRDIPRSRRFSVVQPNGIYSVYDADAIANYILSTGCTRDPVTNREFSLTELRRLSKQSGADLIPSKLRKSHVLHIETLLLIASLEREIGDITHSMIEEGYVTDHFNAMGYQLFQAVQNMKQLDCDAMNTCIKHTSTMVIRAGRELDRELIDAILVRLSTSASENSDT